MKSRLLISILLLGYVVVKSQSDIIYRIDRTEVACKVLEIDDVNKVVKYKPENKPDGPIFSIGQTDIYMIKFNGGDVWKPAIEAPKVTANVQSSPVVAEKSPEQLIIGKWKAVEIYYDPAPTSKAEMKDLDYYKTFFNNNVMTFEFKSDHVVIGTVGNEVEGSTYWSVSDNKKDIITNNNGKQNTVSGITATSMKVIDSGVVGRKAINRVYVCQKMD